MNNQNLIIFNFPAIYETLSEIESKLNFKILNLDKKDLSKFDKKKYQNFIFLTEKKVLDIDNEYILKKLPLKLSDLIKKINIEFLKLNYKDQSNYQIGSYIIDLNSKKISNKHENLKLTEKEIATLLYLSRSKKPIGIKELQSNVWGHKSILETHTVETHIHRLRKKIKEKFNDQNFIISSKEGYSIN